MRKALAVFAAVLFALPAFSEEVTSDCIAPGCVIILKQRAQFILNPATCEWEYIPGVADHGHATIRGRKEQFVVLRLTERDGEEFVIAQNSAFYDREPRIFAFAKVYLQNPLSFSIRS